MNGTCGGIIDLATPTGSERVRGFQPPYRTVYIYRCPRCGSVRKVRAGSFRGTTPEPDVGGIVCGYPLSLLQGATREE